jgi:hypothetical protein
MAIKASENSQAGKSFFSDLQMSTCDECGVEERTACSGRLKRKRDTFLPLLQHAIAYLHEFRVRFNVGLQIL